MKNLALLFCLAACGSAKEGPAGPAGAPGTTGEAGPTGPTGAAAATGTLAAASLHCGGTLQATALSFSYSALVLKSGDVFASGSVYGAAFEIGASAYYAKTQVGAITAKVLFAYDVQGTANGGYWEISVDRTTAVTTIVNHDTEAPGGQTMWTMTPDKCVVNSY